MTAKDLKNALLQEAVQGKLVPQIASEGNARDLLEEIRKARGESLPLATARKRSSATPSAGTPRNTPMEITEDEIPFDIPESWCWCKLEDIVELKSGNQYEESDSGTLYLKVADMNLPENAYEIVTSSRYTNCSDDSFIPKNSIIFPKRGGAISTNKKKLILKEKVFIDSNTMGMIPKKNELLPYLYSWFDFIDLGKLSTGTSVPQINNKDLYPLYFPLPPLAEQKRIVTAIEKFMPLIEEYGKKETVLNELNAQIGTLTKKAILQEAVQGKLVPQNPAEGNAKDLLEQIKAQKAALIKEGKIKKEKPLPEITEDEIPFDIPENWCWCRLGEIVNYKMGKTPPRAEAEWWGSKKDTPWISIADMNSDGYISKTKETMSPKSIKEVFSNNVSPKGTLIMSFKLTVGRVSILDIDATHNEAIISIFPFIDDNKITRSLTILPSRKSGIFRLKTAF